MITVKQGNLLEMEYVYSWISSPDKFDIYQFVKVIIALHQKITINDLISK